jgi:hypothetical protein
VTILEFFTTLFENKTHDLAVPSLDGRVEWRELLLIEFAEMCA